MVYIAEAHAIDSRMPGGTRRGEPVVQDPITDKERREVATTCQGALDMSPLRMLLDNIKNTTSKDYAAHPDRLYLVGKDGRVAFAGGAGPRGFDPDDLEDAIKKELSLIDKPTRNSKSKKPKKTDRARSPS